MAQLVEPSLALPNSKPHCRKFGALLRCAKGVVKDTCTVFTHWPGCGSDDTDVVKICGECQYQFQSVSLRLISLSYHMWVTFPLSHLSLPLPLPPSPSLYQVEDDLQQSAQQRKTDTAASHERKRRRTKSSSDSSSSSSESDSGDSTAK